MVISNRLGQRLSLVATACLMSVALPASAAWAQKVKNKTPPAEASAAAVEPSVTVDIPTVESIGSNVDEDTIRAIFSGSVVDNAETLAGLTATSITIPEINLDVTAVIDGETTVTSVTFSDIVLSDVTEGVAATISLAGIALEESDDASAELGALSATDFNIAGVLGLYGLVDAGGQTELETIYKDFGFEGGSFTAEDISCTMGGMTVGEFKARPLKHSFGEVLAMIGTLETEDDPSPQQIGDLLRVYADMFTAFETTPAEFGGFECSGVEDGKAMTMAMAGMTMGAMSPGVYPSISMDGFDITVEGDGSFQLGNLTVKAMDLSGPIAAIEGAPQALDEAWLTANARSLIPAFEGFSFSNLVIDIADPEAEGERIAASLGAFDLTLGNYINGIPADLFTTASNIVVDLPEQTDDEQLQQLIDLGVTSVDASFTIDAAWSEAEDTIVIDELSFTAADLATVALSGTLANATDALFSIDENESLMAAMGVAIRALKLDINDAGLSDIILARVAADQGADAATMRPVYAGLAEGTVIGVLAGAAEAQKVGSAISAFISGEAKNLTIDLTAKDPAGLSLPDFMAAEDDPTALIGKVNIEATAK